MGMCQAAETPVKEEAALELAVEEARMDKLESWAVGEKAQYYSGTHGSWLDAKILAVDEKGQVEINLKPGWFMPRAQQDQSLRRPVSTGDAGKSLLKNSLAEVAPEKVLSKLDKAKGLNERARTALTVSGERAMLEDAAKLCMECFSQSDRDSVSKQLVSIHRRLAVLAAGPEGQGTAMVQHHLKQMLEHGSGMRPTVIAETMSDADDMPNLESRLALLTQLSRSLVQPSGQAHVLHEMSCKHDQARVKLQLARVRLRSAQRAVPDADVAPVVARCLRSTAALLQSEEAGAWRRCSAEVEQACVVLGQAELPRVRLEGLSKAELNGAHGLLVRRDAASGRVEVQLEESGEFISVKAEKARSVPDTEWEDIRDQVKFMHHRSRAVLALCCAVAMRDRALQESDPDEQRHGELFVEVLDEMVHAVHVAQRNLDAHSVLGDSAMDVEMVCVCLHHLGNLYSAFGLPAQAKKRHHECVYLAHSLDQDVCQVDVDMMINGSSLPKGVLAQKSWFSASTNFLRKAQEAQRKEEEAAYQAKRDKIEKDVQAVQAANTGVCALVQFLFLKYPPLNGKLCPEAFRKEDQCLTEDITKKDLVQVILAYAVDKQHGTPPKGWTSESWTTFCNEISKMLNHYYESFK